MRRANTDKSQIIVSIQIKTQCSGKRSVPPKRRHPNLRGRGQEPKSIGIQKKKEEASNGKRCPEKARDGTQPYRAGSRHRRTSAPRERKRRHPKESGVLTGDQEHHRQKIRHPIRDRRHTADHKRLLPKRECTQAQKRKRIRKREASHVSDMSADTTAQTSTLEDRTPKTDQTTELLKQTTTLKRQTTSR